MRRKKPFTRIPSSLMLTTTQTTLTEFFNVEEEKKRETKPRRQLQQTAKVDPIIERLDRIERVLTELASRREPSSHKSEPIRERVLTVRYQETEYSLEEVKNHPLFRRMKEQNDNLL